MTIVHFITHPEVAINPAVPVPDWRLSDRGLDRMRRLLERPWVGAVAAVFSSAERKAGDAAAILAGHRGLPVTVIDGLGENDRSATGYLPRAEFETVADAFFAQPQESVRGWERAVDAQARIVKAVEQAIALAPAAGDIAILSHGGVGALLLCHLTGAPISRAADQPDEGGGNVFAFEAATRRLLWGWRRMEA